jgi:hypothetical protein
LFSYREEDTLAVPSRTYIKASAFFLIAYGLLGLGVYAAMIAALGFPPLRPGLGFLEAVYLSYANPALNIVRTLEMISYPAGFVGLSGLAVYIMRERFGFGLGIGIFAGIGIIGFATETLIAVSAAELALSGESLKAAFINVPRLEIVLLLDFIAAKFYYAGAIAALIAQALLAIALFGGNRLSRVSAVLFAVNILAWSLATLLFAMGGTVAADIVLSVQILTLTTAYIIAAVAMFASDDNNITVSSR